MSLLFVFLMNHSWLIFHNPLFCSIPQPPSLSCCIWLTPHKTQWGVYVFALTDNTLNVFFRAILYSECTSAPTLNLFHLMKAAVRTWSTRGPQRSELQCPWVAAWGICRAEPIHPRQSLMGVYAGVIGFHGLRESTWFRADRSEAFAPVLRTQPCFCQSR